MIGSYFAGDLAIFFCNNCVQEVRFLFEILPFKNIGEIYIQYITGIYSPWLLRLVGMISCVRSFSCCGTFAKERRNSTSRVKVLPFALFVASFCDKKCCKMKVTWLILPVVICLSQRLSHACASINA